MIETAYAKLNLALHVRARGDDGYHAIETLFAFCEDGDLLTLDEQPGLRVTGPFAAALANEGDNLILRAARAFREAFGGAEVGFTLDKRLPVAAGIGGGSADAAAALRLLARRGAIAADDARLAAIAAGLGADVPACLRSVALRGIGRGDELVPVDGASLGGTPVLLVNPRIALATGPVFAGWDRVDRGALPEGDSLAVALAGAQRSGAARARAGAADRRGGGDACRAAGRTARAHVGIGRNVLCAVRGRGAPRRGRSRAGGDAARLVASGDAAARMSAWRDIAGAAEITRC